MKMKQSAEFTIYGNTLDYDEMEAIWNAVKNAGSGCEVTIKQTTYDERPYGTSTTTYIDVEIGND